MLPTRVCKILIDCFQDFSRFPSRPLTSCLYSRELSAASVLNCTQSSSISNPAVRRLHPSLERHNPRRTRVLNRWNDFLALVCRKFRALRHESKWKAMLNNTVMGERGDLSMHRHLRSVRNGKLQ